MSMSNLLTGQQKCSHGFCMNIETNENLAVERWQRVLDFSGKKETPFQVILSDVIEGKYHELQEHLPFARI